jgi:hypothetical protein
MFQGFVGQVSHHVVAQLHRGVYAERLIGSIRRECLDHVVVLGEQHLRHLLKTYQNYLKRGAYPPIAQKDAPIPRAVQAVGETLAVPILGELHHQYIPA